MQELTGLDSDQGYSNRRFRSGYILKIKDKSKNTTSNSE